MSKTWVSIRYQPEQLQLIKDAAAASGQKPTTFCRHACLRAALALLPERSIAAQMRPLLVFGEGWTQRRVLHQLYQASCKALGKPILADPHEMRLELEGMGLVRRHRLWIGAQVYYNCTITPEAQAMLDAYLEAL